MVANGEAKNEIDRAAPEHFVQINGSREESEVAGFFVFFQ